MNFYFTLEEHEDGTATVTLERRTAQLHLDHVKRTWLVRLVSIVAQRMIAVTEHMIVVRRDSAPDSLPENFT